MTEPTRTYANSLIAIEWRPELCTHCQACITDLPQVFNLASKPWVNINNAHPQVIFEQVQHCPDGALSVSTYRSKQ